MLDAPQIRQLSAVDQEAIRTVIEGLIDAWHRGDAVAFAAAFTDNADFYNVFAHKLEGRAAIERHHAQLFAGIYRGTRVSDVEISMRSAAPQVVVVAWSSVLHVGGSEQRPGHALSVFVRTAAHWQILSFHNMAPLPSPQEAKP